MQHLVDTGLFSDMRYSVDGKALTFALTPVASDQLLTARYTNFVWWKQEELTPLVHARIPLFTGRVPITGTMKDQIAGALAALVLGKGVKAEVDSIKASEKLGAPVSRVDFFISQPIVKVGEVQIDQTIKAAAAKVAEMKESFSGQDYDADQTGPALSDNLRSVFLDLGYLDVVIDPLSHAAPKASANAITIGIATAVHEGAVYHVSQMVWPDSSIVSKDVLATSAQMKSGDLASKNKLLLAVATTKQRFVAVGYIDAKMSVEPQKDELHHEIAYIFSVVPGEQYRLASVKTVNMTAEQQAEFDKNDKLISGQAYNEDAVKALVVKLGVMRLFQGHTFGISKYGDPKTRLVTVTISLLKPGSLPSR